MNNPKYDRIDSLDLIRGIAILSIPLMNIYSMALPPPAYWVPTGTEGSGALDIAVCIFQELFVESRSVSIFTILFGVGLALRSDRAPARETAPRPRLRRRLAWLLVFGLIHGFLLWFGDILTLYAISGFLVLRSTRWTGKRLTVVGVGPVALAQVPMALVVWGSLVTGENLMDVPPLPFDGAALTAAQAEWTTIPARISANATEFFSALVAGPIVLFWHTAGVMLIGMTLYRLWCTYCSLLSCR